MVAYAFYVTAETGVLNNQADAPVAVAVGVAVAVAVLAGIVFLLVAWGSRRWAQMSMALLSEKALPAWNEPL
ncbi:MAG: hypothetical protein ABSD31_17315 [Candidatus Binataceae bacterium]|jgi:hypothetical protein